MNQLVTLSGGVRQTALESAPPPKIHLVESVRPLAFLVEGSRLFALENDLFGAIAKGDSAAEQEFLAASGIPWAPANFDSPLPAPRAISLNIAQSCNLACSYCYADEGRFGGQAQFMTMETAFRAIDRTIADAANRRVTVGFIGGEPFLNREVLYRSVDFARERARACGCTVGFSVTTNGTLLNDDDVVLLRENTFAVSISLDGGKEANDRHRRTRNAASGFEEAIRRLRPLLENPGRAKVVARATIARDDLRVAERVQALLEAGFAEAGVAPLRTSPDPQLILRNEDWPPFLEAMIHAAEEEWHRIERGGRFRFSNLAEAIKQIHIGSAKPLPCGSAANYVSVSADGSYFTCHRTIDNPRFALGTVATGLSTEAREAFLQSRLVDRQEPCRNCWARYLCGGGCHAEVISAGRSGCDYIRGWLDYCLGFYDRVLRLKPDLLLMNSR